MSNNQPVDFYTQAKSLVPHFLSVESELAASTDKELYHLVALRASQINQCAYCVQLHIGEALKDGENQSRLDRLVVWRHVEDFTEREKAAFAWTEALTSPEPDREYAALRAKLRLHFSETELTYLTAKIAMINLWNRIQISNH